MFSGVLYRLLGTDQEYFHCGKLVKPYCMEKRRSRRILGLLDASVELDLKWQVRKFLGQIRKCFHESTTTQWLGLPIGSKNQQKITQDVDLGFASRSPKQRRLCITVIAASALRF